MSNHCDKCGRERIPSRKEIIVNARQMGKGAILREFAKKQNIPIVLIPLSNPEPLAGHSPHTSDFYGKFELKLMDD